MLIYKKDRPISDWSMVIKCHCDTLKCSNCEFGFDYLAHASIQFFKCSYDQADIDAAIKKQDMCKIDYNYNINCDCLKPLMQGQKL